MEATKVGKASERLELELTMWRNGSDTIAPEDPVSWWTLPVSLSSLWRAAGQPENKGPGDWGRQAAPALWGLAAYYVGLSPRGESPDFMLPSRLVTGVPRFAISQWNGSLPPDDLDLPWNSGDITAPRIVATLYAAFLDGAAEDEFDDDDDA